MESRDVQLLSLILKRHGARRLVLLILAATMVLPGCSLGVMAGKLFFDDPKMKSVFRKNTGTDLTKGEKTILIACSTSHQILSKYPGIRIDIVDKMSRILDTHNVKVVPADDVATWFDDHGEWGDFTELADEFDADYVMHIDLKSFAVVVPDSPNLLQGKTEGRVTMMEECWQSRSAHKLWADRLLKGQKAPQTPRRTKRPKPQKPIAAQSSAWTRW